MMTPAEIQEYIHEHNFPAIYYRVRRGPMFLTGLFLELVKQFYADEDNLKKGISRYDPTGKCDGAVSIVPSFKWDPDNTDVRPQIVVDIGNLTYTTKEVQGISGRYNYDLEEGVSEHGRVCIGTVVFAHLAATMGEAVNYAEQTFDLFDAFSDVIKNDFCFEKFDLSSIVKPRMRKETPKDWECLVQANFTFHEFFGIKHESPKLKQISVSVTEELMQDFRMVE